MKQNDSVPSEMGCAIANNLWLGLRYIISNRLRII